MPGRRTAKDVLGVAALVLWACSWSPGVRIARAADDAIASEVAVPAGAPVRAATPEPGLVPEASGPSCQAGTGPAKKMRDVQGALALEIERLRQEASKRGVPRAPASALVVPLDGRGYRYGADAPRPPAAPASPSPASP